MEVDLPAVLPAGRRRGTDAGGILLRMVAAALPKSPLGRPRAEEVVANGGDKVLGVQRQLGESEPKQRALNAMVSGIGGIRNVTEPGGGTMAFTNGITPGVSLVNKLREARRRPHQPGNIRQSQIGYTFVQGIRKLVHAKPRGTKRPRSAATRARNGDDKDAGESKPGSRQGCKPLTLNEAVTKAESASWRANAIKELKEKMFAKSTKASKDSKRRKLWEIISKIKEGKPPFPLDADTLEELGAVILQCKLRAGDQYIAEAKLMQLECGYEWTQVLERKLSTIKRALRRGIGPEKRAKEVKPESINRDRVLEVDGDQDNVDLPVAAFLFASVWMLRCAEVVQVKTSELKFLEAIKHVQLIVGKSKMDQKCSGVKRTLKCCGETTCSHICPWMLSKALVENTSRRGGQWLFADKRRNQITKYLLVKAWCCRLEPGVTGHPPRRSGAMFYARQGMAVADIGFLGRWRSAAIFRYVEDALSELPLNFREGRGSQGSISENPAKIVEVRTKEKQEPEVKEIKVHNKPLWAVSISSRGKVAHCLMRAAWGLSIDRWTTVCGWHFARNNVKVELTRSKETQIPVCRKCKALKEGRDKVRGGVQLAQWLEI
eukprot:Skav231909  [mRNA]  locus=scaffold344:6429:8240:+ [translate_table: standard]